MMFQIPVSNDFANWNELAEKLRQVHRVSVIVFAVDLAKMHAVDHLYQKLCEQSIHVDTLVNNAGFGF